MTKLIQPFFVPSLGNDKVWHISISNFEALETDCGVKLSGKVRDQLKAVLFGHLSAANMELNSANALGIPGQTRELIQTVESLLMKFQPIQPGCEFQVIGQALQRCDFSTGKQQMANQNLDALRKSALEEGQK